MDDRIRQYMSMAEARIGAAFVGDGLYAHMAVGIQGPHTLTFAVKLYVPTAANMARALRLGQSIEAMLGEGPVRVYAERGAIFVEIPSPWPSFFPGSNLRGKKLAAPLGLTSRCTIAGVDFETCPHLLVVGPTNRGKSTAMRALAFHLARQNQPHMVNLLISTHKPGDWDAFGKLAHTWAVISEPQETAAALTWLHDLMLKRANERQILPRVFVFVDDLLNLLAVVDVSKVLGAMVSMGRGAGIHLVIGTQNLGERGAGGTTVTGNIYTRLVFGTADSQTAAYFAGRKDSGAERLGRYPGDALLVTDGQTIRLATSQVMDADLAKLPQDAAEHRPWLVTNPVIAGKGGNLASQTPDNPLEEPVTNGYRRLPWHEPTSIEVQILRQMYADMKSKTQVCKTAYGGKNKLSWRWVDEALAGVAA